MNTETHSVDFVDSLKCPITYEFFRDPVIGSDGHTYERENITLWIQKHASSPITREPMNVESLRPNYIVKKLVEDFVQLSSQKQYRFRLDIDIAKVKQRPIFQSPDKTIYEASWISRQGPAIVLIRIDGAKAKREASFYVQLSCHPHIVRTYGLVESHTADHIMLAQEYAPHGDLSEQLRTGSFRPTLEVLIEIFRQVVDAMICLADNHIIHGDLACRNVLIFRVSADQPTETLVKLTDFGLTRTSSLFSIIESPISSTLKLVPVRHAAPEVLSDASPSSYSEKSDVYSFGVLMWEACSAGATPYGELPSNDIVCREKRNGRPLTRPAVCSDVLWNVITWCTQVEPQNRPDFKRIQEDLITLRFENKRQSSYRMSQVDTSSRRIPSLPSPTQPVPDENPYQWYNAAYVSTTSNGEQHVQPPFYENLANVSKNDAIHSTVPSGDYYVPCEYCLQSIGSDDFKAHENVCSVRIAVRWLVRTFIQLPPLEVTACSTCECLTPVNMLRIHQRTCGQLPADLHNTSNRTAHRQSPVDAYPTFTYLKPVTLQHPQVNEPIYENTHAVDPRLPGPARDAQPVDLPPPFEELEPITRLKEKSSKTNFRKAMSKFKRIIS